MYLILGVTQGTGGCLNSPADNMNMAKSTLYGLHFLSDPKQHSHRNAQAVACKSLKENAEPSASLSSLQATTHSGSFYGKKFRNSGEPQASLVCRNGQVHGIRGTIDAGTEETHQTVISGEEMAAQETEGMDYSVADKLEKLCLGTRREAMLKPLLTMCFCCMHSIARAENNSQVVSSVKKPDPVEPNKKLESLENKTNSRIYDATVIGEPVAIVKDKARVWNKLLGARVVYLGEAELVPDPDDKVIELEIVQNLRDKCFEQQRPISLALQAFPCNLQPQLNQYMSKRISDDNLKSFVSHWSVQRWEEYKPLLHYCCNNGVRLIACGTPLEILRTVQAEGVQALTGVDRRKYVPPAGAEFISNSSSIFHRPSLDDVLPQASVSFGPGSYLFAQARVVENYVMSQIVTQAMVDGGSVGLLVVVTGSTHVVLGSRGIGLPARVSRKMPKRTQAIVLLNPERQHIRKEGEVPVADFLWYSAAKPCTRNCFDRAEIARIMDAAGRRRDALPQDLQRGLDLGLVSPEVLQNFFDLDKQPFIAELTHHFQGFRERWLADPRFLQKLAIEESISITTTLIAQYERRKGHFTEELDYVITDTVRGAVVDFFTVWLPAPTLSFLSHEEQNNASGTLECLQGLLGSLPDNAFQRNGPGQNWSLRARITAVLIGGIKLFCVGLISSLGTVSVTNILFGLRQWWNPGAAKQEPKKRSPVLKTALVYSSFLGTSANLRYQAIAGIVEHWIADYVFASQPIQGNIISFLARTVNSYWGTQQWIDLARLTGLQQRKVESEHISHQQLDSHVAVPLEGDKNNATDGCDGSWTHKE